MAMAGREPLPGSCGRGEVFQFPNFRLSNYSLPFGSVILLTRNKVHPCLAEARFVYAFPFCRKQRNIAVRLIGGPQDHVRTRARPGEVGGAA